ncbi:carotenoid oxygenase family protein [[Leptolyngbya] sp. PCC 7376]|uniref:carotenoid oxygenase family protein n=1 Tax=[Leptolyngbya] sp. PCC 7376 TaxID=111781 RepID=UPI0002F3A24B|nr:carotenoid oxygenase family protein [[Leptolyngbya] sp. PCC 7376]
MVAAPNQNLAVTKPAWSKLFEQPAEPFALTNLDVLAGSVPKNLRGTLFRNGPGQLTRGDDRMGHWFDGDGVILGVYFTDEGVKAQYRYVETQYFQEESAADKLLYPNYGTVAPGKVWQRWGKPAKNSANTSVLPLGDRLLALWEGGKPHALDVATLETLGEETLGLAKNDTFSAHHKIDPVTGEIYNFGTVFGKDATFQVYKFDNQAKLLKRGQFTVKGLPLTHDFVLAGDYLIFSICPVRLQPFPALFGLKSVSDCLQWQPELGTEIIILNRHTLEIVSCSKNDPWFQWHFTNGFVNEYDEIELEMVRFNDFASNQQFVEIPRGSIQTYTKGTLWHYRIDPKTAKILDSFQVGDRSCEFPITLDSQTGQHWDKTFIGIHRDESDIGHELINGIACVDQKTKEYTVADLGAGHYPSEPIPVQNPDNPKQTWILTVVFNAPANRSELRIYDGDRLSDKPICILALPKIIPPSFHGKWQPA